MQQIEALGVLGASWILIAVVVLDEMIVVKKKSMRSTRIDF